jgi:hypothetical protein
METDLRGNMGEDLLTGQRLKTGDWLTSRNGRLRLEMQEDGNVVLYLHGRKGGQVSLWDSATTNRGNYAEMGVDGNFVVYNAKHQSESSSKAVNGSGVPSNTSKAGSYLHLQDDGNVVIYEKKEGVNALWSTKSAGWGYHEVYLINLLTSNHALIDRNVIHARDRDQAIRYAESEKRKMHGNCQDYQISEL